MRVIFNSPIQISCRLDRADEFLVSLLCNTEVIAVNQDISHPAKLVSEIKDGHRFLKYYEKVLEDGSVANAVFNLGETSEHFELRGVFRDLWLRNNLEIDGLQIEPHCCRLLKTIYDDKP